MEEFKSILREVQAVYKTTKVHNSKITSSLDVANTIRKVYPVCIEHREAVVALYLNRANNTVGFFVVGIGGVSSCSADIKLIMQHGILCNASGVVLIHNHPSGNLKPSESDKALTKKVKEACSIMDMQLLDHLILTDNSHFSFADESIL